MNCKKHNTLKPIVSALALVFTNIAWAETATSTIVLDEVEVREKSVEAEKTYNPPKSANQKFTTPLIDTPKSVTVITETLIEDTGSRSLQDALRTTPGITFGSGEGGIAIGDRPYIRGFEAFGSIFTDGLRDLGSQTREVFAIEQVEVLKGPSGAFDGRGSAGGSVNIVSKQAKQGDFVNGSVGLGTDDYKRATVDGNFMMGENAAFRIVAMAHENDVPGRDHVSMERWGVMPSITLGLNSPTQFTASWYHLETDDIPDWSIPYFQPSGIPQGKPISVSKDNWYGVKGRDFQETSSDIGTFKISHTFNDNVVLRNTTRIGRSTNDYFVTRPNVNNLAQLLNNQVERAARNRDAQTDSLINLTDATILFDTASIKHTINVGLELSREETTSYTYTGGALLGGNITSATNPNNNVAFTPLARNNHPNVEAETINKSVYVFDTMDLSDQWLLNAGVRYDSYRTQLKNQNPATGAETSEFENDESFLNYQLGVVYKLQPDANIYTTYATSSSPVGLNMGQFDYAGGTLNAQSEGLSPERTETFEVGTKWKVLNNLDLTAAVFHTKKEDARVNLGGIVANAGEIVVNGFEFGFAGNVTESWSVFGGYTYLDAEQTKVGDSTDPNTPASLPAKGKQMYGIAENSATLWTTYDLTPKFTIGGGAFYMDKVYADPANNAFIPSYVRWDAMAKYKLNEKLNLQLNVQNLTDERYYSATYFRHYAQVAPGRSAFVTLNLKY